MAPKLSKYNYIEDWKSAKRALDGRTERTIGNNTKLVKKSNNDIRVLLHGNGIIRYTPHGKTILGDGGHQSSTTKDRLNRYTPSGYRVVQRDYIWYLKTPSGKKRFKTGMTI